MQLRRMHAGAAPLPLRNGLRQRTCAAPHRALCETKPSRRATVGIQPCCGGLGLRLGVCWVGLRLDHGFVPEADLLIRRNLALAAEPRQAEEQMAVGAMRNSKLVGARKHGPMVNERADPLPCRANVMVRREKSEGARKCDLVKGSRRLSEEKDRMQMGRADVAWGTSEGLAEAAGRVCFASGV